MATTDDLHSNALNFISASVDPRTGQFTAAITLPVGAANSLKGPTPSLNLSYNPFRSLSQGFGVGWQLGLSQWDRRANRLTLSTGESFITVPPVQGEYGFKDRKLPSFRLFSDGSESLKLVHKTGLVEYLTSYGTPIYRLYALRSPEGQRVRLFYDGAMRLTRLVDDSGGVLVSMGYFDTGTEVRLFPQDTTRAAMQVNFLFNGNELRYVRLMDADRASFEFHYLQHASGLLLLQQFIWPTGGRESVGYDSYMQAMPPGAPLTHMPVVWEYVRAPEHGQSASRSTFAYSAHNCHGYGAVTQWASLEDNLYKRVEPYAYDSTETQWADGVATRYIYREFNRFHLQTVERVTCEGYLAESLTQYHDLASVPFALQPAYFQLPRQITQRYARHGQEQAPLLRVEQFRYDDFGNPVWQCDAMGGVQEHVYYPAAGQFEDCPADPLGFVRFVQTSTTYPPPGSQGAPRGVQYRYALLPAPDGDSDHVVPLSAQQYEVVDGHPVDLDRVTQAFVSGGEHHGRMAWSDVQHQGHVTHTEYEYALQASGTVSLLLRQQPTLLTTTRLVGFDGQSVSRNEARSVVHGQLVLTSAEASATTVYDYDSMGRLVTETTAPGTAYEATLSYKHIVSAQGSYQTLTGVAGAVTQIMLDGFGREIQRLQSDVDGALYVSGEAGYDVLGQLTFTRTLEPGVPQADGHAIDLCLETRFRYDGWGNVVKTERPDGVSECSEHDPNALLRTDWLQAGEAISQRTVYELDLRGQPLTRTTWHGRQVVSEHFHYDGFGRLLTHTDALGQVTTHAYDPWDREVSSVLPDGTHVSRDYAAHDPGDLPTAIGVQHSSLGSAPVLLGTQRFDGLGRLAQRVVAGRATDYAYDLAHFSPAIVTSAAGQVHCRYEPALAQALSSFSASGEQLSYEYHPLYGQPVQLSNELGSQRLHYDALGQVDQETLAYDQHTRQRRHFFTPTGRPSATDEVDGERRSYGYDTLGRAVRQTGQQVQVSQAYDAFGRVAETRTQTIDGRQALVVTLGYDDLGREIHRTLTSQAGAGGAAQVQRFEQDYTAANQLRERRVYLDGALRRHDRLRYDTRGRLVEQLSSGLDGPVDAQGNRFTEQAFEYDALDNLIQVSTLFTDASRNLTTFSFSPADPCQLTQVRHSRGGPGYETIDLEYDLAGRLVRDELGRTLGYDVEGRLISVDLGAGQRRYRYAPGQRVGAVDEASTTYRYYQGSQLSHELAAQGDNAVSYTRANGHLVAQTRLADAVRGAVLLGTDAQGSVLGEVGEQLVRTEYSAYGRETDGNRQSLMGFTGQRQERDVGWYVLGDYRVYSPRLMRFHSPDAFSPFGGGGLNAYAYCAGDPVNRVDPNGTAWWSWVVSGVFLAVGVIVTVATAGAAGFFLIGAIAGTVSTTAAAVATVTATTLGVASIATGVAAMTLEETGGDEKVASILGWVSLGTGLAAVGLEIGTTVAAKVAAKTAKKLTMKVKTFSKSKHVAMTDNMYGEGMVAYRTHGAPDGVMMSRTGEYVTPEFVAAEIAEELAKVPVPSPVPLGPDRPILLIACYGADETSGAAQTIANVLRRPVYGLEGVHNSPRGMKLLEKPLGTQRSGLRRLLVGPGEDVLESVSATGEVGPAKFRLFYPEG